MVLLIICSPSCTHLVFIDASLTTVVTVSELPRGNSFVASHSWEICFDVNSTLPMNIIDLSHVFINVFSRYKFEQET